MRPDNERDVDIAAGRIVAPRYAAVKPSGTYGAVAIEHITDRTQERIPSSLFVLKQCGKRGCERVGRVQFVQLRPARPMDLGQPLADQHIQHAPCALRCEPGRRSQLRRRLWGPVGSQGAQDAHMTCAAE